MDPRQYYPMRPARSVKSQVWESLAADIASGSKYVVNGSWDLFESISKKTLDSLNWSEQHNGNLSVVVREHSRNDEALEENFAHLFEKNDGMVHLEGLEMLSATSVQRVEAALIKGVDQEVTDKLDVVRVTYEQLFEVQPEGDKPESNFEAEVSEAVSKTGFPYKADKLIQTEKRLIIWPEGSETFTSGEKLQTKVIFRQGVMSLAEFTARCMETLHKMGQLVLVAGAAPDIKPFFNLVQVMFKEIDSLTRKYATHLKEFPADAKQAAEAGDLQTMLADLFMEAKSATNFVHEAFRLLCTVIERSIVSEKDKTAA
uniref:Uncharacterized protein n=1 Tax=Plectus sambesii TaxID=2011161 RepID=A0A914VXR7_9BILA